jgi:hypothetical protein
MSVRRGRSVIDGEVFYGPSSSTRGQGVSARHPGAALRVLLSGCLFSASP